MKDKKKKNRLWSGEFKLKVVLDIIENELSYSQAARKYDMYLSSGTLNDTLPARWVYQYRLYGKERFSGLINRRFNTAISIDLFIASKSRKFTYFSDELRCGLITDTGYSFEQ